MTQEDKELLLNDLSARLPYWVKVKFAIPTLLVSLRNDRDGIKVITESTYSEHVYNIEDIKPYLRPMSSITEEEKEELKEISSEYLAKWENAQDSIDKWILDAEVSYKRSKFYNSHFLDWHGLIPKNLAIEAPVDMYKID